MHECDFVNRQELQTQLLQFHFSLQPTLQLDSKDSSKRGSSSKPKVKFWPLFGDFHCFFLLRVVKFTHWLICLGWIERSQVREDGRINGEENGKWEEGRWWPVVQSIRCPAWPTSPPPCPRPILQHWWILKSNPATAWEPPVMLLSVHTSLHWRKFLNSLIPFKS